MVVIEKMDSKGRIVIPKDMRTEMGLRKNQKIVVELEGKRLIVRPAIGPGEFSKELKGCVEESRIDPMDVKKIWKFHDTV